MTTKIKNTLTLNELLTAHNDGLETGVLSGSLQLLANEYKNPDGSDRGYTRFNSLMNGSTGAMHWFPSCFTARETVEWEEEFATHGEQLRTQMEENAMTARRSFQLSCVLLLGSIFQEAVELSKTNTLDGVLDAVLAKSAVSLWALSDAYAVLADGELPDETTKKKGIEVPVQAGVNSNQPGQEVFSDVYGVGGRVLASDLWDILVNAFQNTVAEQEQERRASKPVSKAAKRKAASKARKDSKKK